MKVGILGGGQLALMLAEAGAKQGLEVSALTSSKNDPVSFSSAKIIEGDLKDTECVEAFANQVELLTWESEFIPVEKWPFLKGKFLPAIETASFLRNKRSQKETAKSLGIPTADFAIAPEGKEKLQQWVEGLSSKWGNVVLKWGELGYDGKGVCVAKGWDETTKKFCDEGSSLYAEKKIDFDRELALVGARSTKGEVTFFPAVESIQKNNICHHVLGPAMKLGLSAALETLMQDSARSLATETGYVGTFATEWFQKGEVVYLNEIAPRVHNSGHITQLAFPESQFDLHWRALKGEKLQKPVAKSLYAMWNLLGVNSLKAPIPLPQVPKGARLQWYGKSPIKAGRKMGHVNGVAADEGALRNLVKELEAMENEWHRSLA